MIKSDNDDDESDNSSLASLNEGDQVLDYIGDIGRYQILIISAVITLYVSAMISWQTLVMSFHFPPIDFLCKPKVITDNNDESLYDDYDYAQWQEIAFNLTNVSCFI